MSSDRRTFQFSSQAKGGLVDATPWDANMDAEQKLKGRVSVDQRMMTAQCQQQQQQQQQRTGDAFTAAAGLCAWSYSSFYKAKTRDMYLSLMSRELSTHTSEWFMEICACSIHNTARQLSESG